MSLREDIVTIDYRKALKEKNTTFKLVLAELKGAIQNKEIETKTELSDKEVIAIVKKANKELGESVDGFVKAHNESKVSELEERRQYIDRYLPAQISDESLHALVRTQIAEFEDVSMKDMGRIMGLCKSELSVLDLDFDGKKLSEFVKSGIIG